MKGGGGGAEGCAWDNMLFMIIKLDVTSSAVSLSFFSFSSNR